MRTWATGGNRKTDAADALHVAQVALFRPDLRQVTAEDQTTIPRLLTERRDDLVHERTRVLNRLHAVLRDLLPGGAATGLTADKAATAMKGVRPVTATDNCRRDIARDLLADPRRRPRTAGPAGYRPPSPPSFTSTVTTASSATRLPAVTGSAPIDSPRPPSIMPRAGRRRRWRCSSRSSAPAGGRPSAPSPGCSPSGR
ncbi:transposase [Streptomyces sp. NPDC058690]|uniref:IS110 family transposase n=1 Tax=Streptomyces sp. NPDC058690 TaxID=3346600 RepID=UPI00364AADE4